MSARTRWVQYEIDAVGAARLGGATSGVGTRGYSVGGVDKGDVFDVGPTSNRLYIAIDGQAPSTYGYAVDYITLTSGTELDPRFIAREITELLHDINDDSFKGATCKWENHPHDSVAAKKRGNRFVIYSGTLGSSSGVTVASGTNTAHINLGFGTPIVESGVTGANTFGGTISVSGTYGGLFDEVYKIVMTNDNDATRGIGTITKGGTNTYDGTMTTGGVFNFTADETYTIYVDATNGTTMGAGTGNVPKMGWACSPNADDCDVADSDQAVELLYTDHWYKVGTRGLMVKFTDAVFNTCTGANTAWTIPCYKPDYVSGSNTTAPPNGVAGTGAEYAWSSDRGDMSTSTITAASGTWTRLGSRGLYIQFNPTGPSDDLGIRDEFYVVCAGPDPYAYDISSINYGNVTVSTNSDLKCVMFEVMSGAVAVSTVKFGLQNHGSFLHHKTGNLDTEFRFGTVGPVNKGGASPVNGKEWFDDVTYADIQSDTPITGRLYATVGNLSVVSTADDSESIGSGGLTADPMWLNIKLGASETGSNSTINYRLYFDYN